MKTILIPTDFTIESLNTVKEALKQRAGENINLILVYGAYLSDSITDLLFISKPKQLATLQNKKFTEACEILRNKYDSQINSLRVELFSGHNQRAFEHFLTGNAVDELYVPRSYRSKKGEHGFDLLPFFQKSTLPLTEIEWLETTPIPEKDRVAELFLVSDSLQPLS
jgi:hypothetical protein